MHQDMNCCHLDISLENILLQNAEFIQSNDGKTVSINEQVTIQLGDFGMAELFKNKTNTDKDFNCSIFIKSDDSTRKSTPFYVFHTNLSLKLKKKIQIIFFSNIRGLVLSNG